LPLSAQSTQVELPFADAIYELDATDCDGCGREAFQAKHGAQPGLNVAMILLDQIVEVLRRAKFSRLGKPALLLKFPNGSMGSGIKVECDGNRRAALRTYGYAEECLCRGDVAMRAEPEIDCLACRVDRPVKIGPLAADSDVDFVNAPRRAT
jgi:hypothetical protein